MRDTGSATTIVLAQAADDLVLSAEAQLARRSFGPGREVAVWPYG